jgi:hypothetical protein
MRMFQKCEDNDPIRDVQVKLPVPANSNDHERMHRPAAVRPPGLTIVIWAADPGWVCTECVTELRMSNV